MPIHFAVDLDSALGHNVGGPCAIELFDFSRNQNF